MELSRSREPSHSMNTGLHSRQESRQGVDDTTLTFESDSLSDLLVGNKEDNKSGPLFEDFASTDDHPGDHMELFSAYEVS